MTPLPGMTLTPTQHRLLQLLAAGRIEKTVRNQLTHLYAKLGVANRAEAVAVYLRSGAEHLAPPQEPPPAVPPADRDIRPIAKPVALG